MRGTLTIAGLTWMEARRRRIVLAAAAGGLLYLLLYALAVSFASRANVGQGNPAVFRMQFFVLIQIGLYVASFLSYAVAILLPIDTLSGEIDSGVMQTLASKPISRSAILLGKTLTYWLMSVSYLLLLSAGVILSVYVITGVAAVNLERALPVMVLGTTVPLAVSLAGGTSLKTITNGIVAFGYYGLAFLAGWIEQIGAIVGNDAARRIGTAISLVSPADAMWRRAAYELQPELLRGMPELGPFGAASVPSDAMIVWTLGVVALLLALALYLFRRRAL
jgi:hypothetical protein